MRFNPSPFFLLSPILSFVSLLSVLLIQNINNFSHCIHYANPNSCSLFFKFPFLIRFTYSFFQYTSTPINAATTIVDTTNTITGFAITLPTPCQSFWDDYGPIWNGMALIHNTCIFTDPKLSVVSSLAYQGIPVHSIWTICARFKWHTSKSRS